MTIAGKTSITNVNSDALVVSGGISIGSGLTVGTTTSLGQLVTINTGGLTIISGGLRVQGGGLAVTNSGGANISGNVIISNGLTVQAGGFTVNSGPSTAITSTTITLNGTTTINGTTQVNGQLNVTGDVTAFFSSDKRLKANVTRIPDALKKLKQISGVLFDWNEISGKTGTDVGVIAQEIKEVLPEVVATKQDGYLAVRYEKIVPLLIEAIKELEALYRAK